jgi:hypothetical protein
MESTPGLNEVEKFKNFKFYDMHANWGSIVGILKANRGKVNDLLLKVKRQIDKEFENSKEKIILKKDQTLTPLGLSLDMCGERLIVFQDELIEYALENGKLPAELVAEHHELHYYSGDSEDQDTDDAQDLYFSRLCILEDKILNAIGFRNNDYLPIKWLPYGRCHWYHPVVGLFLAKRLIPDGDWKVFATEGHTTIYCEAYKLCFDLLVWGHLHGKASTYSMLFGNEYKPASDEESILELQRWLVQVYED